MCVCRRIFLIKSSRHDALSPLQLPDLNKNCKRLSLLPHIAIHPPGLVGGGVGGGGNKFVCFQVVK